MATLLLCLGDLLPPVLRRGVAAMEARVTTTVRRQTGWLFPLLDHAPGPHAHRRRTWLAAAAKDSSSGGVDETKKKKPAAAAKKTKTPTSPFLDQPPAYLHMVFPGGDSAAASVAYHHTDSHVPHVLRVRLETRAPSSTSPPSPATEPLLLAAAELVKHPEEEGEERSSSSRRKVWGTRIWVGDRPGTREATYEAIAQGMGAAHALGLKNLQVYVDEAAMAEEICGVAGLATTSSKALQTAHATIQSSIRYFPSFVVFVSGVEGPLYRPVASLVGKEGEAEDLEPYLPPTTLTPDASSSSPQPEKKKPSKAKAVKDVKRAAAAVAAAANMSLIDPSLEYLMRFDGGSRGNPGPSGAGIVIFEKHGRGGSSLTKVRGAALWLGADPPLTNNEAEYKGLIAGLQAAKALGIKKLCVEGDSQLIVRQLLGEYKVRNERLKPLHAEAEALVAAFTSFDIQHIERAENADADALANQAMDEEGSSVVGGHGLPLEDAMLRHGLGIK